MKWKRVLKKLSVILGAIFVTTEIVAKLKKASSIYENELEQKNPLEGKKVIFVEDEDDKENADGIRGHLEAVGDINHIPIIYEKYVKRMFDVILSFGGLVVLSPLLIGISLAIKIDDPGPVLFTQKRMGQNKKYFKLHKFRSMKMCTPHDKPTHMLENPEQYITRVGKFLRAHSLDELPQIWDIFIGNMSVIGPRPGLWNQDLLTAERDKYGANDVKPGLTGWAQINGRDELEITEKAKLDGEYCKNIGLKMDAKVFLKSIHVIGKDDSVVEGGTGELRKIGRDYTLGKSEEELIGKIGFGENVVVDTQTVKNILITGAGSYIGESFCKYANEHYPALLIDSIDMLDPSWQEKDFSKYDIVYHVAGIAHADVGNVDDATKAKYYKVNTDLAVEVCEKAKAEGVKELIFMSSMIIYGDSAPYGKKKVIDEHTVPCAANFYGDSKLQADVAVRDLADDRFKVLVIRPPMIYGKGSKGNYPVLAKIAKKLPIFPDVDNERSMLHIDNLCEFLCQVMLVECVKENAVVLIPQNAEWTKTCDMVKEIGEVAGKKIWLLGGIMKFAVALGGKVPGKIGGIVNKAFGNNCYTKGISIYPGINYQILTLKESIKKTED
ncbi:sugar transferase [bacterium 210702-DFI.5.13]|nr:sugar transferase [bacterium 210702-DFI.5.13]